MLAHLKSYDNNVNDDDNYSRFVFGRFWKWEEKRRMKKTATTRVFCLAIIRVLFWRYMYKCQKMYQTHCDMLFRNCLVHSEHPYFMFAWHSIPIISEQVSGNWLNCKYSFQSLSVLTELEVKKENLTTKNNNTVNTRTHSLEFDVY